MEPGHPSRQDPPTEHSHDQVNGSPPRPVSRRGWMSDSPLDGGSGWPTSAYAIVPRQPAPPQEESVPKPGPEPSSKPSAEPSPEPEAPPASRRGRLALVLVGLVVLIVVAVGGVLAARGDTAEPDNGAVDAAAITTRPGAIAQPAATTGEPALPAASQTGGATGSAGASSGASEVPAVSTGVTSAAAPPAAAPSTAVLRAGTAQLAVLAGRPDEAYDFDSGTEQTAGADATAGALGLSAANGARFAVLPGDDTPSQAACSAVPAAQWTGQVVLASLLPGAKVCVRTSEDRYAWFMTRAGEPVGGALYSANLDFIVYKKAGD
jgi:hypothetical protein